MLKLIRLNFKDALHLSGGRGDQSSSYTTLRSDTLYAALYRTWADIGNEDYIPSDGVPAFALSSCFPFTTVVENTAEKFIYFMPRPFKPLIETDNPLNYAKYRKELKKIQWLDLSVFTTHTQTQKGFEWTGSHLKGDYLSINDINPHFIVRNVEPKVTVPRDIGDAMPFYVEQVRFLEGSGLYFLFEGTAADFDTVTAALDVLQYEGFGSDRSTGHGLFEYEVADDISVFENLFNTKTASVYSTNLSLLLPQTSGDIQDWLPDNDPKVGYELVRRGGWITDEARNSYQKQSVMMFVEGSILHTAQKSTGTAIDVKPKRDEFNTFHPIYRIGKSLNIPIIF